MNEFERDLLLKFCEIRQIDNAMLHESLGQIRVTERDFTSVGVYITFATHPCLKIAGDEANHVGDGPGALLNVDRIAIGPVFYIDNGHIATIECYTFGGDSWPDEITCYEITEAQTRLPPFQVQRGIPPQKQSHRRGFST